LRVERGSSFANSGKNKGDVEEDNGLAKFGFMI